MYKNIKNILKTTFILITNFSLLTSCGQTIVLSNGTCYDVNIKTNIDAVTFSPDSKKIAFVHTIAKENRFIPSLYTVDIDGKNLKFISELNYYHYNSSSGSNKAYFEQDINITWRNDNKIYYEYYDINNKYLSYIFSMENNVTKVEQLDELKKLNGFISDLNKDTKKVEIDTNERNYGKVSIDDSIITYLSALNEYQYVNIYLEELQNDRNKALIKLNISDIIGDSEITAKKLIDMERELKSINDKDIREKKLKEYSHLKFNKTKSMLFIGDYDSQNNKIINLQYISKEELSNNDKTNEYSILKYSNNEMIYSFYKETKQENNNNIFGETKYYQYDLKNNVNKIINKPDFLFQPLNHLSPDRNYIYSFEGEKYFEKSSSNSSFRNTSISITNIANKDSQKNKIISEEFLPKSDGSTYKECTPKVEIDTNYPFGRSF
jgi:hypothetical protein